MVEHDHGDGHVDVRLFNGEEGGDCRAEDSKALVLAVFNALFKVLVPGENEEEEFLWYQVAGSGGEEFPEVPPPGSGEPGAVYVNDLFYCWEGSGMSGGIHV